MGVYTMENNNTNTEYHKFLRVGNQKIYIQYFYAGSFQVPPKNITPT